MNAYVTIHGVRIPRTDCISWHIEASTPKCRRGLDLAGCDSCEMKVAVPNYADKIKGYVKAAASKVILGSLDDAQYEARVAACRGCKEFQPVEGAVVGFCGACGCGTKPSAELSRKARMPMASCPRKVWAAII